MKTREGMRGFGRVYQPTYRDRTTGEQKQSPVWRIRYYRRGKQYDESSFSTSRADALRLLKKRHGEISRGGFIGPEEEKVTFDDLEAMLVTNYVANKRRSLERAKDALTHVRGFFGDCRALAVGTDTIMEYVRGRQEEGAKNATIKYELCLLKRCFNLAVQAERLSRRPYVPTLEVHNVRTGFFEEPDFRAVQQRLPEELRPVVEFLYLTGWRKEEVLGLRWSQIDFVAQTVRLEPGTTKNDEGRVFPFREYPALKHLLECQREVTLELQREIHSIVPWVFHRRGVRVRDFRKSWLKACRDAGVVNRIPHDFRRTAVRNLERAGVSRSVAMKLTGHKTESIYRRYAIVAEADMNEGVKKLASLQATLSGEVSTPKVVDIESARIGKVQAKQTATAV